MTLARSLVALLVMCAVSFPLSLLGRDPGTIRKDGWHTGERQNLDVTIEFYGEMGETVTDEDGTTYNYYGQSIYENKVYPPEYWGVFPLYFFGSTHGITVSVENKNLVNTARLSIGTESYVLRTDGSNAGTLLEPSSFYLEVGPGETKTFDASFTTAASAEIESGLDRFLVKVYEGTQPADGEVDFTVTSDGVIPNESFRAQIEVIGSAIEYGSYDVPVTVQLGLGSGTVEPFGDYDSPTGGNVNDGNNPRVYQITEAMPAGTLLTVSGQSWLKKSSSYSGNYDSHWNKYIEVSSDENSDNFVVLKNGDDALSIPGYNEQTDLEDYLADYIVDGKIVLGDTQAIFLFELGTTNLGSTAADFQDLVVLITLEESGAATGGSGEQGDLIMMKEGIFCPPEYQEGLLESLQGLLP